MLYFITKTIVSAIIIVAISEISKRSSFLGAILASLPLVSFLGMIWLYIDTNSKEKVSQLSMSVFWMVIPSLSLFLVLPILLKRELNFYLALIISTLIMVIIYFIMIYILKRVGITI
jgi:ABC-type xylose transport system permease subunit